LRALETEIRDQTRELEALRTRQERERHALEAARVRRAQLLAALNRQLSAQQDEIERLRADERRLQRLLQELRTVLPEAELPSPGPQERFGALNGRLPLPLAGRIAAGYGEPKGIGDLTWRGIFIAAREGDPVRAVARGRVAFADWLRGFGLLLILDHGDGYMTLYGHNQALHRRTGDWVEAGETIAAAGNTGGAPAMGVYFEIRQNGVPHDPLQWCAAERTVPARARREYIQGVHAAIFETEPHMNSATRYTLVLLLGVFVGAGSSFDMTVMADREPSKSVTSAWPIEELRAFTEVYARIKSDYVE